MTKPATLKDLLELGAPEVSEALKKEGERNSRLKASEATLGGAIAELGADELNSVLDTEIYGVLARAWVAYAEIKEAAEKSLKAPGELHKVDLTKIAFTHTIYPTIEFIVNEKSISTLKLTLELEASLKAVVVGVRDAKLESISAARGSVVARLKYDNKTLKEMPSSTVDFPGCWKLDKPIAVS